MWQESYLLYVVWQELLINTKLDRSTEEERGLQRKTTLIFVIVNNKLN